jgi:uncharacterized membrane protein YoaT (DUF817 family)
VTDKVTPVGDVNPVSANTVSAHHLSAGARFALAAVCCGIFLITVILFARMTAQAPLSALRNVSFTFWGVFINFALCLGTVAYVSRRLHKARMAQANAR